LPESFSRLRRRFCRNHCFGRQAAIRFAWEAALSARYWASDVGQEPDRAQRRVRAISSGRVRPSSTCSIPRASGRPS